MAATRKIGLLTAVLLAGLVLAGCSDDTPTANTTAPTGTEQVDTTDAAPPTVDPTGPPSGSPTVLPTDLPSGFPTDLPTDLPSGFPTDLPSPPPLTTAALPTIIDRPASEKLVADHLESSLGAPADRDCLALAVSGLGNDDLALMQQAAENPSAASPELSGEATNFGELVINCLLPPEPDEDMTEPGIDLATLSIVTTQPGAPSVDPCSLASSAELTAVFPDLTAGVSAVAYDIYGSGTGCTFASATARTPSPSPFSTTSTRSPSPPGRRCGPSPSAGWTASPPVWTGSTCSPEHGW